MNKDISQKFDFKSLIKFTIPTVFMMVITGIYTITDSMFVSIFINTDALGSVNIAFPIINILMAFSLMFASGGCAYVSFKLGLNKKEEACESMSFIYVFACILVSVIAILVLFNLDTVLKLLGSTSKMDGYARSYLITLLLFTPFQCIQILDQAFLCGCGLHKIGMRASIVAGVINMVLDYLFMGVFNMGISGAALGTGIAQMICSLVGLWYLFKKDKDLYLCKPKKDYHSLIKICFNGSSEMVTNLSSAVVTLLFNLIMLKYLGEDGVAGVSIMLYAQFLFNSIYIGFSIGVAPIISYNYGSNSGHNKQIIKHCIKFLVISSIVLVLIAYIVYKPLISIFTSNNQNVYDITTAGFVIFNLSFLFAGYNIFASSMFTAYNNGIISSIIATSRTFIFIVAGLLLLPELLGVNGIWLALPLGELLSLILVVILFIKYRKKYGY